MANRRLYLVTAIIAIAILAIAGLLLLMSGLSASETASTPGNASIPTPAKPAATPEPLNNDQIVATVNDQTVSQQTWQQATRLDAVMNQLAGQPLPTAEETLDRLINEIIVLEAVRLPPFQPGAEQPPSSEEIEARILALETAWAITDDQVVATLTQVGLQRTDLVDRVSRLIQVEKALNQLAAQKGDLDAWLAQARASTEIGIYRSLVAALPTPAVSPSAVVPTSPSITATSEPALSEVEGPAPPAEMSISPYPQNAAPDFTLAQLKGDPLTLSSFRGKPVLINFWATWCPPCRRELPALQAAYTAYQDKIGFIAVNVKEDAAAVAALVDELDLTFPIALDPDGQVSDVAYEVRGIPTTIFVDAFGVVAARHVGPLDETTIENYLAPLLEAKTPTEEPGSEGTARQESTPSPPTHSTPDPQLQTAPDFTLTAATGETVSLQDFRDRRQVVLVFYRSHT